MKIYKLLAVTAGLAFITANVSAQAKGPGGDPAQMAQKQTAQIKSMVTGITPDQESKILAIEQQFDKTMQDAKASSNGDRDAMRAKLEPARQDRDTKIKAILTADQATQYDKMVEAHQAAHKAGN
jgi:periplasmic protein CpxP/Spy